MLVIKNIIEDLILGEHDETLAVLRIYNYNLNKSSFNRMVTLNSKLLKFDIGSIIIETEIQEYVDLNSEFRSTYEDSSSKIVIKKKLKNVFFTESGFKTHLSINRQISEFKSIYLGFIDNPIYGKCHELEPLYSNEEFSNKKPPTESEVNLIKHVRSLNDFDYKYLPKNVSNWIFNPSGLTNSSISDEIAKKLISVIAREIVIENESIILYFRGTSNSQLRINFNKNNLSSLLDIINQIASWIYLEGKDIDPRIILFSNQMSINLPINFEYTSKSSEELNEIFSSSLESSKLAYNYHLQETSSSFNLELINLNKSLFEYIGRIRANTISLLSSLWRDFTTVIAFVFFNFSLKKMEIEASFFEFVGYGLVVYLIISILYSGGMGFWYYNSLTNNLNEWRSKIYAYLTDDDYNRMVKNKLSDAQNKYIGAFLFMAILYIVMICLIIKIT